VGLGDLTSRQAVLDAAAEFDRLGRKAFLAQYGFGPAREYFLLLDGRRYDSKAITGAAHGYQFPELGPMRAEDFSGGEATVRRRLAELGFTVESNTESAERAEDGYWVFVCNPRKWAIDRFLASGDNRSDTWGIRPSDSGRFAPGQLAIIRVGVDRRSVLARQGRPKLQAGIYALCEVETAASPGTGANDEFWSPDEARGVGWPTVGIKYLRTYMHQPLTIAKLKAERPDLSSLLLDGFQASSFPISRDDFRAVLVLLGEDPDTLADVAPAAPVTADELALLEERYLTAVAEVRERISRSIERGPVGRRVKKANGFRCLVCAALGLNPIGFRKPDGDPYVEAHHVMPVAKGDVGSLAVSNVITVCANHHRQLHYGGIAVRVHDDTFDLAMPNGPVSIPRHQFQR
jgi:predicted RNA-binding protein with PUA-like domain